MPGSTNRGSAAVLSLAWRALWDRDVPALELLTLTPDAFAEVADGRLIEAARQIDLPETAGLKRDALAERLRQELLRIAADCRAEELAEDEARVTQSKFDLGQKAVRAEPEHIPWGYGFDRITAMCVDPDTLFCYWELTDQSIDEGRAQLGPAGAEAWVTLRVYDVTGRIFDGTNAHSYSDVNVARTDRHWFVHVGRPSTTHCVEVGMKSREGYFVRLARSGRVDFPRHEPAPPGPVEWLTVRSTAGEVGGIFEGGGGELRAGGDPPSAGRGATGKAPRQPGGAIGELDWDFVSEKVWGQTDPTLRREWVETGRRFEWIGPLVQTQWEAGPFPIPVEAPQRSLERLEGPTAVVTQDGLARVLYGPWQVVIRGLGGWAERRVLATWQVYASWLVDGGALRSLSQERAAAGGASEANVGASELAWMFGSEAWLGGASEVYFLGASELRLFGASEQWLLGASEYRLAGASEYRLGGASEYGSAGASEEDLGGASEARP